MRRKTCYIHEMREHGVNDTQTATVPRRPVASTSTVARRLVGPGAFGPPTGRPLVDQPVPAAPLPEPEQRSILEQHRVAPPATITHERSVTGEAAEALWEAYRQNFEPLEELAVLQHLYTRDEMLEEFANPRILKIVGWQAGSPIGLAMVTNSLEDVPQISPRYLRRKYPEYAARDAIYFGILVMVSPGVRGLTLFSRLSTELWQVAARDGGVLIFDVCDFNRLTFDAETLAKRIAENFPHSSVDVLDRQTWYVAELPEPIAISPHR
jgi:hypothetical protein